MTSTAALDRSSASPVQARLRTVDLSGPAGRLEAVLNEGSPDARFAALVCHPHPMGGGTLHNKVVYHAMKVLNDPAFGFALPVLRFNFRGTGRSQGRHHGQDEVGDVAAAMAWLQNELRLPLVVCGFSFGAAMALKAVSNSPGTVRAVAALGLPTEAQGRQYHYTFLAACTFPKLFLSGDRDEFAPASHIAQIAANAAAPKQLILIQGGDHFFSGQLDRMQESLRSWLKEQLQ